MASFAAEKTAPFPKKSVTSHEFNLRQSIISAHDHIIFDSNIFRFDSNGTVVAGVNPQIGVDD